MQQIVTEKLLDYLGNNLVNIATLHSQRFELEHKWLSNYQVVNNCTSYDKLFVFTLLSEVCVLHLAFVKYNNIIWWPLCAP